MWVVIRGGIHDAGTERKNVIGCRGAEVGEAKVAVYGCGGEEAGGVRRV